jgi:alginate O-acetyltransferase complex protein AlgI
LLFCEPFFLFLFLPAALLVYFLSPARAKNLVLTAVSLLFYSVGEARFLGWLLASVALNYWIAKGIASTRSTPWCRRLLVLGIVSDLALLVAFKYATFLARTANHVLHVVHVPGLAVPHLFLPLGISFFTFHKISYKVDVYRGAAEACRNPVDLALYILFFPQLIAGPIVRYHEIAGALVNRTVDRVDFAVGVRRFVLGLGKKMIVANGVAQTADRIYTLPPAALTAGVAWLGVTCYAIQLYFDFAGYSDMAIGLARLFGFRFPENFDNPYWCTSMTDLWRRWHISLVRWFRDYLYIPLGGTSLGPWRTYANIMIVFVLTGFWHGAGWTFILWGAYHGVALCIERAGLGRLVARLPLPLRHAYPMLIVLTSFSFFRADTLPHGVGFLSAMYGLGHHGGPTLAVSQFLDPETLMALTVGCIGSAPVGRFGRVAMARARRALGGSVRRAVTVSFDAAGMTALAAVYGYSLVLVASRPYNPFIYFRF